MKRDGGWREVSVVVPRATIRMRVQVAPSDADVADQTIDLRRIASERPIYPTAEYDTRVRLVYLDGGDLARRKLWRGLRIEQTGACQIRHAYLDDEGTEFHTEYETVEGDATGRTSPRSGLRCRSLRPSLSHGAAGRGGLMPLAATSKVCAKELAILREAHGRREDLCQIEVGFMLATYAAHELSVHQRE